MTDNGYREWTPEEMALLADGLAGGLTVPELAARLGRSRNAVQIRKQRFFPKQLDETVNYGWGQGRPKRGKFWTPERVREGLADFARRNKGPLPTSDHHYAQAKKGHLEWPTAAAVLELFGTMADAWAAVGAPKSRYSRGWVPWTQADDDYLLEHAGEQTLKVIAKSLGRSWGACKRRLYDLGAGRARDVAGYLSAMQVAQEYGCPLSRVERLIATGELPARKVTGGHYWRIEPEDCERIREKLAAPKRTYTKRPADVGDYNQRYGYRRVRVAGRVVRVAS